MRAEAGLRPRGGGVRPVLPGAGVARGLQGRTRSGPWSVRLMHHRHETQNRSTGWPLGRRATAGRPVLCGAVNTATTPESQPSESRGGAVFPLGSDHVEPGTPGGPVSISRSPSSAVTLRLLDLLLGESMRPGARLPGERALAESLGGGRGAVRAAASALEVLGIVETRAGSGTYLRSGTSELLPSTLSWS